MKQRAMNKQMHSKQSGFTLIELVIVIIILGILAATAVPKFVDMQGDAQISAMKGVKGALEGAASITYAKAALDGNQKLDDGSTTANGAIIAYGYPEATAAAFLIVAGITTTDWSIDDTTDGGTAIIIPVSYDDEGGKETAARSNTGCNVTYTEATLGDRPTINIYTAGC